MANQDALRLAYFAPSEFGPTPYREENWWSRMDLRLLMLLDSFRHQHGRLVEISKNGKALGRHDGPADQGDHNVDHWGTVRAVDCFAGIENRQDAEATVELALDTGFNAVGIYPHWNGGIGLHLGTRETRTIGDPAQWGAINKDGEQVYVAMRVAMNEIERG